MRKWPAPLGRTLHYGRSQLPKVVAAREQTGGDYLRADPRGIDLSLILPRVRFGAILSDVFSAVTVFGAGIMEDKITLVLHQLHHRQAAFR